MEMTMLILRLIATVLMAVIAGKLVGKLRLPGILGFLLVGMIFGPYALSVFSTELMEAPWYETLSRFCELSVGIMFAKDLVFRKMKAYGKQVLTITLFESIGTFIVVSALFAVVFAFMKVPLYVAVIFGGIALATAPAPALSIVTEFRTKGELTKALIPIAILDDVVAMAVFFTINAVVGSMGSAVVASPLAAVGLSIGVPIILGVVIGYGASAIYATQSTARGYIVWTGLILVATCVVAYFVDYVLLPTPSINYMMLGMALFATVTNRIQEADMERLSKAVMPYVSVGFTIMILNLAAPLDYHLILSAGILTFVYIVSRGLGKYFCARLGGKVSGASENLQKYLGLTFLPHSGVSLVFTGMAVASLSTFDTDSARIVQGTIAAAAVINEIFAVILAKKGFELAGEIEKVPS